MGKRILFQVVLTQELKEQLTNVAKANCNTGDCNTGDWNTTNSENGFLIQNQVQLLRIMLLEKWQHKKK